MFLIFATIVALRTKCCMLTLLIDDSAPSRIVAATNCDVKSSLMALSSRS